MTAVLYLPTWQRLPLYPETHWQSKSFPDLTHVPPFLQGLGSHTESVKEIQEFKNHLNIHLMSPATLETFNKRCFDF